MSPPLTKPSSTPAKQDWHPSSLVYAAIPNLEDDFDSITSEGKSTAETRTDLYDLGRTTRRWALAGLVFSGIFSISCIITGALIVAAYGGSGLAAFPVPNVLLLEMISLALNLIVTVCTESTGFAHSISLRSALASESRLRFNVNLRLLTAARGWRNPNGILLNGAMAILLILSYALSSLAISSSIVAYSSGSNVTTAITYTCCIVGFPLLLLGVALLLQVVIALLGIRSVKILTWSSSPFDVTAALVHHIQLTPVPLRCMRGVSDVDVHGGPTKPFKVRPSAWDAHPSIRKVIMSLWGLVVACAVWAALVVLIWSKIFRDNAPFKFPWSFFPTPASIFISWSSPFRGFGGVTVQWWILFFATVALVQGPLTLGLHCSELIASVIRDERYWRHATRRKGLRMKTTSLNSFFTDPFSLVLFVAKPILHWMFGLSFSLITNIDGNMVSGIFVVMYLAQIGNLCIALSILACFFTVVALYRPRGPQPAAYGHLQTLANLIDEWSPVMWWGHKEDGTPYCHAGTSDHPLEAVQMDCVYAGSDVMCHPPDLPLGRDLQA